MTLKVTFLGAGGSTLTENRSGLGILVNNDLLLECGDGITQKLIKSGDIDSIEIICITHLHCDHYIGIFTLLWHMWIMDRKKPLRIIGPQGIKNTIETILKLCNSAEDMASCKVIYEELEDTNEILSIKSKYNLNYGKMDHDPLTFAFKIEDPDSNKSICYSGDYKPNKSLKKLAKDCNLLISEATFPNNLANIAHEHNHSTALDAAKIGEASNSKKLALIHISAYFKEHLEEIKAEARSAFSKEVILPEDFMVIEI